MTISMIGFFKGFVLKLCVECGNEFEFYVHDLKKEVVNDHQLKARGLNPAHITVQSGLWLDTSNDILVYIIPAFCH